MKITSDELKQIADLSRIKIDDNQIEKYVKDLNATHDFVEKINEVDVDQVVPKEYILDKQNVYRKDELKPSYNREYLFQNAPSWEAGCISVPKVVE